jgi:hypothetical protein
MGLLCTFELLSNTSIGKFKFKFNSNQLEQLKCVVCYCNALIAGQKKNVINYKSTNGIFSFHKHLETNHHQLEGWWSEQKKGGPKAKKQPTKNGLPQPLLLFPISLVFLLIIPKMIPIKSNVKRTLCY